MTPSNPTNQQPLIYRIADKLGVFHLVAPVDHTHAQSEVNGLETALAAKANTTDVNTALAGKMDNKTIDTAPTAGSNNLVSSGGVATALAGKADVNHNHTHLMDGENNSLIVGEGYVDIELNDGESGGQIEVTVDNMPNLARALQNPDTTPTANSTKLVTSGGVATALAGKANSSHSHTVSQITDFNSAVATKVNAGVAEAIRGVAIKDVEVDANTTYDLDDHMADMKGRQALILLTNADPQENSIYKYIISGTGIDISFDDSNRKLENGVTYLISIIYMENETTYHNGWYFVSVLSTFS